MALTVSPELERRAIDVVRGLALDAPDRARSGHQGTAMALAPLGHVLWSRVLRYDAGDPAWPDRDRLVLWAGHAWILLYILLFLTGYGLTLEDLEEFLDAFKTVAAERGADSARAALEDMLNVVPATSSLAQRKGELVEAIS